MSPLALPEGKSPTTVEIIGLDRKAISYEKIQLADTFDTSAKDYYCPAYHHSPTYGWMNDPNGMIYKDGVYHLYYQYNPYGLKWGNMYWGHSSSRDLIHWEHHDLALARDTLGHIFSGSAILDKQGTAGFGKDAILATTRLTIRMRGSSGKPSAWPTASTMGRPSRSTLATPFSRPSMASRTSVTPRSSGTLPRRAGT